MDGYLRVSSSRLKLGPLGEDCLLKKIPNNHPQSNTSETTSIISNQTGIYVWIFIQELLIIEINWIIDLFLVSPLIFYFFYQ